MHRGSWRLAGVPCLVAMLLVACGDDDANGGADPEVGGAELTGSLTVFATASLADAFAEMGRAFDAAHPALDVQLNVASSSSLREQILSGAPADVFASADVSDMERVLDAGEVEPARTFARNRLQVVVPAGNSAGVVGLADFDRADLLLGLCAAEVPCGRFARQVLEASGIEPAIDTDEPDVRALLTKVAEGELDAGIVYVTDVVAGRSRVEGIEIPEDQNVDIEYPIAVATGTSNEAAARAFVEFVLSDEGQAILSGYGFREQ